MSQSENISTIVKMGFNEELVRKAYKTNGNDKEKTISFLVKLKKYGNDYELTDENESDSYEDEDEIEDPLACIKSPRRLAALKNLVYQEAPEYINSAIQTGIFSLTMGNWNELSQHQEPFFDLLCNNSEIEKVGKMKCEIKLTAKDLKDIEKLKSDGFADYLVEQAFLACNKNIDAAIEVLEEHKKSKQ